MRHTAKTIGQLWVDLTRTVLYILLAPGFRPVPWLLVSQGVVQTFSQYKTAALLQPTTDSNGNAVTHAVIAVGPAASQIAIKQLGTNGGGFLPTPTRAHPFEKPDAFIQLYLEMLSILMIPAALCYTFGKMVGDTRQGLGHPGRHDHHLRGLIWAETVWANRPATRPSPRWAWISTDQYQPGWQHGRQGCALRRGQLGPVGYRHDPPPPTARSTRCTTRTMPLGGMIPLWLLHLGEVIYGRGWLRSLTACWLS